VDECSRAQVSSLSVELFIDHELKRNAVADVQIAVLLVSLDPSQKRRRLRFIWSDSTVFLRAGRVVIRARFFFA
jgi:hypothetical protein